ncbi:MAG: TlyA family RNA methyltransferase [Candidatus Saccharimonadales bacterium]
MPNLRLDQALVQRGLVATRSQAEHYIKLGYVSVNGRTILKAGTPIRPDHKIALSVSEQYVSRAALKLASVVAALKLDFENKIVLDVGSSTGGFTDYALKHGAAQVIAVDVGSDQMHPSLRGDKRLELYEKTDIRDFKPTIKPNIILIDVSFISLRAVLPAAAALGTKDTQIVAMLKPQFEAGEKQINKGIVKNDKIRRQILSDFEQWAKDQRFTIGAKADSGVAGTKGNLERFYRLSQA